MDGIYGVAPSFVDPPQFAITDEMPYPPPAYRRPCHWAQLHAGIQYIIPIWERNALIWYSRGIGIDLLSDAYGKTAYEVRTAIHRVERTLATWEREQDPSATRYVMREPASLWPDGARERDRVRDTSSGTAPGSPHRWVPMRGKHVG